MTIERIRTFISDFDVNLRYNTLTSSRLNKCNNTLLRMKRRVVVVFDIRNFIL